MQIKILRAVVLSVFTQKKSIQTMLSGSLYACCYFISFRMFPEPAGQCSWNDRIHASY